MNLNVILFSLLLSLVLFTSCQTETSKNTAGQHKTQGKLPILGEKEEVDGKTVYHTIPNFAFINQDSNLVTNATFKDQIYVVDFFFTSCPTICPKVKRQILRLYDKFENETKLKFLSHSIDIKYDTPDRLKKYADKLGIKSDRWHLVTGEEDEIFEIADDYFIAAHHDNDAPGGFDHSGRLILVDQNRMVRGFCEGTDPESVTEFMNDIQALLNEK